MSSRQHCVQSHINGRPEEEGLLSPGRAGCWRVDLARMRAALLAALLAVVSVPSARAVWLGGWTLSRWRLPRTGGPGAT